MVYYKVKIQTIIAIKALINKIKLEGWRVRKIIHHHTLSYYFHDWVFFVVLVLAGRQRAFHFFCVHLVQWTLWLGKGWVCQDCLCSFHFFPEVHRLLCLNWVPLWLHCLQILWTQRLWWRCNLFFTHNHGLFFIRRVDGIRLFLHDASTVATDGFGGTEWVCVSVQEILMVWVLDDAGRVFFIPNWVLLLWLNALHLVVLRLYRYQVFLSRGISNSVQCFINALSPVSLRIFRLDILIN